MALISAFMLPGLTLINEDHAAAGLVALTQAYQTIKTYTVQPNAYSKIFAQAIIQLLPTAGVPEFSTTLSMGGSTPVTVRNDIQFVAGIAEFDVPIQAVAAMGGGGVINLQCKILNQAGGITGNGNSQLLMVWGLPS